MKRGEWFGNRLFTESQGSIEVKSTELKGMELRIFALKRGQKILTSFLSESQGSTQ
ncbi:MAG TPA: hypothetical protein PKJ41_13170 [Bryobacteraceae bacterium]|nr:hypothetical protein [Bryobacteraceae bacterium]